MLNLSWKNNSILGDWSLKYYSLPQPSRCDSVLQNKNYLQVINYNSNILAQYININQNLLNNEKSYINDKILESIEKSLVRHLSQTFY